MTERKKLSIPWGEDVYAAPDMCSKPGPVVLGWHPHEWHWRDGILNPPTCGKCGCKAGPVEQPQDMRCRPILS